MLRHVPCFPVPLTKDVDSGVKQLKSDSMKCDVSLLSLKISQGERHGEHMVGLGRF